MLIFFFFQAEDGIRDATVTGVQTCALPISPLAQSPAPGASGVPLNTTVTATFSKPMNAARSEERRVGKECRSRWAPDQEKKKQKKAVRRRIKRINSRDSVPRAACVDQHREGLLLLQAPLFLVVEVGQSALNLC